MPYKENESGCHKLFLWYFKNHVPWFCFVFVGFYKKKLKDTKKTQKNPTTAYYAASKDKMTFSSSQQNYFKLRY